MREFVVTYRGTDHVVRASHPHVAIRMIRERLGLDRRGMWRFFEPRLRARQPKEH